MAEEPHKPEGSSVAVEVVPVIEAPPPAEEPASEKKPPVPVEEAVEDIYDQHKYVVEGDKISQSVSFKEETNVFNELPDPQKKALDEFKQLIQEALNKHEFTAPPTPPPAKEEEKKIEEKKEEEKPVEEEKEKEKTAEGKKEEKRPVAAEPVKVEVSTELVEEEPPPVDAVIVELIEKVTDVDEDGSRTVETIQKTIVAVAAAEEAAPAENAPVGCKEEVEVPAPTPVEPEQVFIWGILLLGDERSDVILLKFLRARDFKVKEAFTMIKNTIKWRKDFGIENLLEEDLGIELEKVVFMDGVDKEGHPVCYNVYGEFQNKEFYKNTFLDEEKRSKFLRWRIQFLEKSIRKLDFSPTGISTFVQINDIKNFPFFAKKELRQTTNQALQLLQDNYPEFVAKQIFVNVPWWYLAFNTMISPFLTQRTKQKFVFAGPSKTAEIIFKYIAPEQVPVQYGGLSREEVEREFTSADSVTGVSIKPSCKDTVEFPVSETCNLVWELRVLGWDVSYGAEFVPIAEDGYTVIVQKTRMITPSDEPVICNSFKISEPGKVVLTINNQTSKKKLLLYRFKTKL